jgi:prepilin-type N-terminal cleavage/methylation domain-containing protein
MNPFSKRGFTLIELLVVIAIIGILSSIVLASLNSARQRGRDARRISDIKQIQLALELYYDANSAYPSGTIYGSNGPLAGAGYISIVPFDPSYTPACNNGTSGVTGTEAGCYKYTPYALTSNPGVCVSYHIGATLENTSNAVLSTDANLTAPPSGYQLCGSTADFDGTGAVYDVKP